MSSKVHQVILSLVLILALSKANEKFHYDRALVEIYNPDKLSIYVRSENNDSVAYDEHRLTEGLCGPSTIINRVSIQNLTDTRLNAIFRPVSSDVLTKRMLISGDKIYQYEPGKGEVLNESIAGLSELTYRALVINQEMYIWTLNFKALVWSTKHGLTDYGNVSNIISSAILNRTQNTLMIIRTVDYKIGHKNWYCQVLVNHSDVNLFHYLNNLNSLCPTMHWLTHRAMCEKMENGFIHYNSSHCKYCYWIPIIGFVLLYLLLLGILFCFHFLELSFTSKIKSETKKKQADPIK